ncbi:hypothetical protein F441_12981 [Phytophthora nicotianae CJ01A1]|uniref:Uncharacterized protein n=2 Tax=Phytophthora nicotianae TaxID=4792 RepID=W2WLS4_PHYNI|nr:hypothetical protein L914_02707 [Phytophthora nicotianae]ETP11505.1 hypothetical protein F441_12981 [Phytophthora nicotianae CJ01A1]
MSREAAPSAGSNRWKRLSFILDVSGGGQSSTCSSSSYQQVHTAIIDKIQPAVSSPALASPQS